MFLLLTDKYFTILRSTLTHDNVMVILTRQSRGVYKRQRRGVVNWNLYIAY